MNTGPSRVTRTLVARRARHCCELCGEVISAAAQVHHRSARRMGGSSDPRINSAANLLHLCWRCHRFIEEHRTGGYTYGWLCPMGVDPAQHPVLILGRWYYLTESGGYRDAPDPTEVDSDA